MNKNFIIAALSIVILSGFTSSVPMEYEYYMMPTYNKDVSYFNMLGKQGWEYCGTQCHACDGVFKRLKR